MTVDGRTVLTMRGGRDQSEEVELAAGEHALRVEAPAFFEMTRVTCVLYWRSEDGQRSVFPVAESSHDLALTDDQGIFRFENLDPGSYRVRIHSPGEPDAAAGGRYLRVEAGQPTEVGEIRVAPFRKGNWRTYARGDGLAHENLLGMHESRDGALWIATQGGGLSRWDGRNFTRFTTVEGLPDNNPTSLSEDPAGNLWIGATKGVARWDGSAFTWFGVTNRFFGGGDTPGSPLKLLASRRGAVWVGSVNGVFAWDGQRMVPFPATNGTPVGSVTDMVETKDGGLHFLSSAGLWRPDGTNLVAVPLREGAPTGLMAERMLAARDGSL